jgi:tRNA dimethylallyltransferase
MEKNNRSKIIVILGPTASGKSDVAVRLALRLSSGQAKKFGIKGAEVISADSRQVYKGLDIGTGKITKKEMRGVPHHLLDVVSLNRLKSGQVKQFTVSEFKQLAEKAIQEILKNKKVPIICGGTGFYIDALLGDKQIPEVPPNLKLRKKLEKKTAEQLFEMLKKLDPERAKNIDAKNPRRLVRAIEICEALGKVPPLHPEKQDFVGQAKYEILKIGIRPEETELKNKINKRIDKWFKLGFLKEVWDLHNPPVGRGLSWKCMSEIGLEYKLVAQYYTTPKNTMVTIVQLKEKMRTETWHYAKRQITWFKRDKSINWFDPKEKQKIEYCAKEFLKLD